jgi:hypothetical protein
MGSSSSQQSSSSASTDNRVTTDNGGIGVTGSSNVNISTTSSDPTLVNDAFAYLTSADASINTRSQQTLDAVNTTLKTASDEVTNLLNGAQQAQQNAASYVTALANSTPAATAQTGSNNQTVIIAALIGAVALFASGKG